MALKRFTIEPNEFLSQRINAYYRCDYIGFGRDGNPDYINHLKNTFNSSNPNNLRLIDDATDKLTLGLESEIIQILQEINSTVPIVICVIPRAKRLEYYHYNQLLFSLNINEVINELIQKGTHVINGSNYIRRHTDTKTTHLAHSPKSAQYAGDGDLPYVGITKNTCYFDNNLVGKHVLLIDDIYTKTVNVDEDCIQALLDFGVTGVTFFSIAKTVLRNQSYL
ncbi:hypothetical protein MOXK02_01650 [Moraxella sp. K02]